VHCKVLIVTYPLSFNAFVTHLETQRQLSHEWHHPFQPDSTIMMDESEPIVYKTVPRSASSSSLASSSLKTPASAPIGRHLEAIPSGHSVGSYSSEYEKHTAKMQSEASSRSKGRHKTMKQLQQEVERRSQLRSRPSYTIGQPNDQKKEEDKEEKNNAPLKALTDLLFQTAVLGINTTAKVTKPTLSHVGALHAKSNPNMDESLTQDIIKFRQFTLGYRLGQSAGKQI
jgi:hypothetical protein